MMAALRTPRTIGSALKKGRKYIRQHPYASAGAATLAALIVSAFVNRHFAARAERDNPPVGRFLDVNGVRLHYIERGKGQTLVLLHGNGSMIQDFESSGLIDLAAKRYRVVVFDRPGFGHSTRPRNVVWTPDAQAELLKIALERLGVTHALVLGHSWGASVAISLALNHPELVHGLVLASGYYYPTPRFDVIALSAPAIPMIGDAASLTLVPIIGRLTWPLMMLEIFGPRAVPGKFSGFPKEMAVRPSQVRASAAETALMIPDAFRFRKEYSKLKMPVSIIAGEKDRLIDIDGQSARLHENIVQSRFHRIPDTGHMIHQTDTSLVMAAIDEIASG